MAVKCCGMRVMRAGMTHASGLGGSGRVTTETWRWAGVTSSRRRSAAKGWVGGRRQLVRELGVLFSGTDEQVKLDTEIRPSENRIVDCLFNCACACACACACVSGRAEDEREEAEEERRRLDKLKRLKAVKSASGKGR